jgi:uridylate kinase
VQGAIHGSLDISTGFFIQENFFNEDHNDVFLIVHRGLLMRVVLKLGGSLLYNEEEEVELDLIRSHAASICAFVERGNEIVVVVGGGRPARKFISAARALGANEAQCDWLGIKLARNNAELLSAALHEMAYPKIVETLDELEVAVCLGKVVLMGGLIPGQSTNAVAALAAESIGAEMLLNATNVDGVYDRDPREGDAKKLDVVTIAELRKILTGGSIRAGEYKLFDPVAIRVVERSKIKTVIFDGRDPQNLDRLLRGEKIGSEIVHG